MRKITHLYAFKYTEESGLDTFAFYDTQGFIDNFDINWESEEMKDEVVSEIGIHFVGKRLHLSLLNIRIR